MVNDTIEKDINKADRLHKSTVARKRRRTLKKIIVQRMDNLYSKIRRSKNKRKQG